MKVTTMDLKKMAMGMIAAKIGGNLMNNDAIGKVMGGLLGGTAGGQAGGFDIGGLVNGMKEKGMGDVADSWLGDGENADISPDQLKDVLGADKISAAAAELGTDEGSLLEGLREAVPQMVDKSSSGGSLLDSLGGLGGVANMAKKFL